MADHNKDADVPVFDIGESGRVDLTLYKMDTGFLLRDNVMKKDHSISKMDDLESSLELVIEGLKGRIRELMRARDKFDYIDIGVMIQEGEDAGDPYDMGELEEPETLNLGPDQLADVINSIIGNNPMGGFPPRGGHRNPIVISGQDVMRAINSPRNIIQMKTRIGDSKRKSDKTENLHRSRKEKKFFHDKTKNERNDDKGKNDDGQGEPTVIT